MPYRLLLLLKLVSVLAFAGGCVAALLADSDRVRRLAVHQIASPALVAVWLFGYLLTQQLGVAVTELWIVGGFGLSLVTQLALVRVAATGEQGPVALSWTLGTLLLVVALMVYRLTWSEVSAWTH